MLFCSGKFVTFTGNGNPKISVSIFKPQNYTTMNKNRLNPVGFRAVLAPLCISLFCMWGGVNCLYAQEEPFFNMLKVYDRHGIEYELRDIEVPAGHQMSGCSGMGGSFNFELVFEDNETDVGFDDPTIGAQAQEVVCQVFTDLSYYIIAKTGKCSGQVPTLRILIQASELAPITFPPEANFLGDGSPYYYNHANTAQNMPSWAHGNVWRTLNGGEDNTLLPPFAFSGTDSYHGYMRFNMDPSLNWNFDLTTPMSVNNDDLTAGPIRLEFYQCVLRAALQLLGIHSFIGQNGNSIITNNAVNEPGLYTHFDKYLVDNAGA
ncbi:hypothetical protein C7N43_38170, partial [Sphingobacteriales bacterium UPWRP_1]